jgi:uncharacterized protein YunC (DUF1805 family)
MGHADHRLTCEDVVVAGSHSAVCAVQLFLHLRLRGVIGHAAGPGLDEAGVGGLEVLSGAGVPGAAVSGASAPIADGLAMYERGQILRVNEAARGIGIEAGMPTREAAILMATRRLGPIQVKKVQHVVYEGPEGRIIALDTIAHGDERINRAVICMGSHSGDSMADYVEDYDLRGTITNDAGMPLQRSATRGLDRLAERGIPAAVVRNDSARVGDGRSTYKTGILSEVNEVARALGLSPGMPAAQAAKRMLAAAANR